MVHVDYLVTPPIGKTKTFKKIEKAKLCDLQYERKQTDLFGSLFFPAATSLQPRLSPNI